MVAQRCVYEKEMAYVYLSSPYSSTMFTTCCGVVICDDERCCSVCGRPVIGYDAVSSDERGMIRWRYACRNKASLR